MTKFHDIEKYVLICEINYLTEKEAIRFIQRKLGITISRRIYYYYKSKLWKKNFYGDIEPHSLFQKFELCHLINRKSILKERNPDIVINGKEDKIDFTPQYVYKLTRKLDSLKNMTISYQHKYSLKKESFTKRIKTSKIPSNATIRAEYIFCKKSGCYKEHGPYYYAYWRNKTNKKLAKKYVGSVSSIIN